MGVLRFLVGVLVLNTSVVWSDDYYELLGISRNADNREIRKAFKKLALKLHPDKNDEEGAHDKFLKINRAYEVLKDEELRKKYDMFGEEGMEDSGRGGGYQSWSYYHDDFGIYDDDIEIVTLDYGEFQRSVLEGHDIWFINFYSPRCGHCHDLAPTWRKIAKQLQGVIRIGAVNCQDEFMLCQRQGIRGYPSLNLYTIGEGTLKYSGRREEDDIMDYVSRFLNENVIDLWSGNYNKWIQDAEARSKPWLMILCSQESGCPDSLTRKLVGAALEGLVSIGLVDCDQDPDVCKKLNRGTREENLIYFPGNPETETGVYISASVYEHREITSSVLHLVPGPTQLDDDSFREMRGRLDKDVGPGWLLQFTREDDGESLEYKKLVHLVPRQRVGKLNCGTSSRTCRELAITKYPTFVVFKVGGGYEISYGKTGVQDIATFARIAAQARTMKTLSSSHFPEILQSGKKVFIDFFAPWCPPCMRLLPEFRKASSLIGGSIVFGTVDCTLHHRICNQYGIRAYPTSIFFNGTDQHPFNGDHNAEAIADFVKDILRPVVVKLTERNFHALVGKKTVDEVWLVDFYAPWCGPCRQLEPHWAALGRKLEKLPHVKIGKVDCQAEDGLCDSQAIRSFPTIRLYPLESVGVRRFSPYQQYHRDVDSLYQWVQSYLPSSVENITPYSFQHSVLKSSSPWLVEFYAPWCGACVRFAAEYEQVALSLKGKASVGKINCDKYRQLCSKAGITGYPTVRFYRGADKHEVQDYFSEDINTMDPDTIVDIVEERIKQSKLPGTKDDAVRKSKNEHDELE